VQKDRRDNELRLPLLSVFSPVIFKLICI